MKNEIKAKLPRIFDKRFVTKFLPKMLLYIGLGAFFGWLIYMSLSLYDPNVEARFGFVGRTNFVERMVSVMSPESWGWLFFFFMLLLGIIGDPYWRISGFSSEKEKHEP